MTKEDKPDCLGVVIALADCPKIFNPDLVMKKGFNILRLSVDLHDKPELLRAKVEQEVKRYDPYLVVQFTYAEDGQPMEKPVDDYVLQIAKPAPMYSNSKH